MSNTHSRAWNATSDGWSEVILDPRLIFVVGPTAVGKSAFALAAAERWGGAILNADSLQVYQGLDIGTAKPDAATRARVPHFLFDHVPLGGRYTAGDFHRDAVLVIEKEWPDRPLFITGGSGFYLQALEKGMFDVEPVPEAIRDEINAFIETRGLAAAHAEMDRLDPVYGGKVPPPDRYRIFRALTLMKTLGKTMTEIQADFERTAARRALPHPRRKLGFRIERERLRERVRARARHMIAAGLADEVKGLLAAVGRDWPPLQSVGYKETIRYLDGGVSQEEWLEEMVLNTMKLAKRQMTWFQRDPDIQWFDGEASVEDALKALFEKLDGG